MIAPVDASAVRANVTAKDFQKGKVKGHDHEKYFLYVDGKKTSWWVKLSHGVNTMRVDEIKANARPLKIPGEDLYKILCCQHDRNKTIALYRETEEKEAALACANCAAEASPDDLKDDRGRLWHHRCAVSELQREPWRYDRSLCPRCGGSPLESVLEDQNKRLWHLECATAALASRNPY